MEWLTRVGGNLRKGDDHQHDHQSRLNCSSNVNDMTNAVYGAWLGCDMFDSSGLPSITSTAFSRVGYNRGATLRLTGNKILRFMLRAREESAGNGSDSVKSI